MRRCARCRKNWWKNCDLFLRSKRRNCGSLRRTPYRTLCRIRPAAARDKALDKVSDEVSPSLNRDVCYFVLEVEELDNAMNAFFDAEQIRPQFQLRPRRLFVRRGDAGEFLQFIRARL